ncbi:MAG: hypothetical protein DRJ32_06570 [Thermoprotei archaeon]|nr:MAG: hypothetical protein DRJ32_06570 [Thermoprotei archaeon]
MRYSREYVRYHELIMNVSYAEYLFFIKWVEYGEEMDDMLIDLYVHRRRIIRLSESLSRKFDEMRSNVIVNSRERFKALIRAYCALYHYYLNKAIVESLKYIPEVGAVQVRRTAEKWLLRHLTAKYGRETALRILRHVYRFDIEKSIEAVGEADEYVLKRLRKLEVA